jgi:hypothetical protein
MNNLDQNRFFFCPTSITLAEEMDKIFSRGSPPKQSDRDDIQMMSCNDNGDNNRRAEASGPSKLTKIILRREGGAGSTSRNHVNSKILFQKNVTASNAPLT